MPTFCSLCSWLPLSKSLARSHAPLVRLVDRSVGRLLTPVPLALPLVSFALVFTCALPLLLHVRAQTINLLRAFSSGGYADINKLHAWNMDFVRNTSEGSKYREMAAKIEDTLRFMNVSALPPASKMLVEGTPGP